MSPAERRSASERRDEILDASMDLFARHGLHGVTTKMIAEAAGISEALIYRHWKSKEDLYYDLEAACLLSTTKGSEKLAALEASTGTLVLTIYVLVRQSLGLVGPVRETGCVKRMTLTSLVGNGAFARRLFEESFNKVLPTLLTSLEAAAAQGDLEDGGSRGRARLWLAHHLALMVASMALPESPVVDYGLSEDELVEEVARFALRGLGLREAAIDRHFAPKTFAHLLAL